MSDLRIFQRAFMVGLAGKATTPMTVYRNTVMLGVVDALRDNFPVTRMLVGDQTFDALAVAHARVSPPASPILAHYGGDFPAWLAAHEIVRDLPYLADVAACERLWVEALHAADAPVLTLGDLQKLQIEDLLRGPLHLHPAARFVWQDAPGIAIWLAHQTELSDEIALEWSPAGALFTRPELTVEGGEIDTAAYHLLCGIASSGTLGAAAGATSAGHPDADIGSCFAGLVQRGAFAAFTQERSTP